MNKSAGQVTILVLLLGLLGLTVSMGVVSRSLQDVKQVTFVDQGAKALAAAEASLQIGLSDLENQMNAGSVTSPCVSESNPPPVTPAVTLAGISRVQYQLCANPLGSYDSGTPVNTDDVVDIDTSKAVPPPKYVNIFWQGPGSVEVSQLIFKGGAYSLYRYAANGQGSVHGDNKFSAASPGSTCTNPPSPYANATWNCWQFTTDPYNRLVRIKPLYAPSRIAIEMVNDSHNPTTMNIPTYSVIAWATTVNGTKRKVQATWTGASLPAVFDNVLFSQVDILK